MPCLERDRDRVLPDLAAWRALRHMKHPLPKLTSRRGLFFWVGVVIIIWCVSTKAYAFAENCHGP